MKSLKLHNIQEIFKKNDIDLHNKQVQQFVVYLDLILQFQKMYNLTGFKNPVDIVNNLFIDSLKGFNKFSFTPPVTLVDIGTGAGIPSIPIKIAFPYINLILIESTTKKCNFTFILKSKLKFENIIILNERAENTAHNKGYRENIDIVVARAVASLNVLSELSLPFLKINGHLIAYKGIKADEEIKNAQKALKILGGEIKEVLWYTNKETKKINSMVIVRKKTPTPEKYPRKPGIPQKRPI